MGENIPLVVFVALACLGGFLGLSSMESHVTEALEAQRRLNVELTAAISRSGAKHVSYADAVTYIQALATGKKASPVEDNTAPESGSTGSRAEKRKSRGGNSGTASRNHTAPRVVIEDAVREGDGPQTLDREGRLSIAPAQLHDTDDDDAASEDLGEVRLTPAPPPPRPPLPKLEPGRQWPEGDANFGFESDDSLPTIGVVTLNAQASAGGGRGLSAKSSWLHRMSYTNKNAYCKKWGYDFIVEDNSIIDPSRDVAWSKVPILKKWLPKYQWLMWVDMDAFFMRFDQPITDLVTNDVDFIVAKDWHGFNLGVFFIRNSPWALELLDRMWNSPRAWWNPWEEQSAFMALMNPSVNPGKANKLLRHVMVRPQREMNSYGAEFAYGNMQALYRTGDRLVHFPNCKAIPTCRSTIETFYRQMLNDNGLEDLDSQEVPASQLPES